MPKATRRHSTKPTASLPQHGIPNSRWDDPVVGIANAIEHLWDAHTGAENEAFNAKMAGEPHLSLREQCDQIVKWRTSLENVASYAIATSMAGATIQMALAVSDLDSLEGTLEASIGEGLDDNIKGLVSSVQRMVKSALDVMVATMGDEYDLHRKIISTYAHVGEASQNWLNMIDNWADQAQLEVDA